MKNLALAKLQHLSLQDSLAHAWLFVGAQREHKLQLVTEFCRWLLCTARQGANSCGKCKSCHLYSAGTHPDFCQITPQEDKATILIDDIRVLNNFISGKPQFGMQKVVLISAAEKMNKQAANALLKSLEEPGPNIALFLLAPHADLLLDTIVSRCQVLNLLADSASEVQATDAVGLILQDLHNLWVTRLLTTVELSERWVKQWPNEVLYWFELVLSDLLLCRYTQDPTFLKYAALYNEQAALNSRIQVSRLLNMLQQVQQARYWFGTGHKPNLQLVLENIILE